MSLSGTASTMRRAIADPLVGVRLETAPRPVPAAGEVLVRSSLVGICGSDTHALAGHHPFLTAAYVPGHEAIGRVESVGDGVSGFRAGQRVLLKPNVACGRCLNCREDRSNACESLAWIGCDPSRRFSGAMADAFVAPAANLFAIPDTVDDDTAVLVECLATPVHAARIAGDLHGRRVVVLGAGTIGALCIVAARDAGATTVVATDMDEDKLARATRIGADAGVLASADAVDEEVLAALGGRADVVFDCVAAEFSIAQAVRLLRRAGTLLLVGVPPRPAAVNLPIIQDWELRVQGCAAYTESDIITSIRIAAEGRLPASEIISARYPLDDVVRAFDRASAQASGKVLIAL